MSRLRSNMLKYEKNIDIKNYFNTLMRLVIGFPLLIGVLSYFFFKGFNFPFIFFMILLLFAGVSLLFFFRNKFFGNYYFSISNNEVVSNFKGDPDDLLTYSFPIKSIKSLVKKANTKNSLNAGVVYFVLLDDGTRYDVSSNFLSPDEVFNTLIKLRPDLSVSSS